MSDAAEGASVALICNSTWYAWNFRANTIRALRKRGCAVTVIAPPDASVANISTINGVSYLPWRLSMDGSGPFREGASLVALVRHLRRIRPALVFSFTIKPNIYAGLACWLLRIPYAPNVTGLGMVVGSAGFSGRLLAKLYAITCSCSVRLFVQNANDLEVLREFGLSESVEVVRLNGSGVDLAHFSFRPMPSGGSFVFVFIGRLQEDKGIREFVEAAHQLHMNDSAVRFVVVGGTEHTNASGLTAAELDTWRSKGVVDFIGTQEDIRPWLWKANVLVLPSHGGEGVPRAILEAASTGRPAIVSDVPGCRDAVIDRETGFVVPARNPSALVEAMSAAAGSVDRIAEMGRNARRLAEARFSEESVINEYLDCLEHVRVT